jgi:hypothetical protein
MRGRVFIPGMSQVDMWRIAGSAACFVDLVIKLQARAIGCRVDKIFWEVKRYV